MYIYTNPIVRSSSLSRRMQYISKGEISILLCCFSQDAIALQARDLFTAFQNTTSSSTAPNLGDKMVLAETVLAEATMRAEGMECMQ